MGAHDSVMGAMQRYRCFCMTEDDRIITGAFIEAEGVADAISAANKLWNLLVGFHHVEVWVGSSLLRPANAVKAASQNNSGGTDPKHVD